MSNIWFFQANPKHYDIDAALAQVTEIWWRVPQYTSEVRVGDVVVVWRSGKEAGIVAVGRVASPPQQQGPAQSERAFVLGENEDSAETTRVKVRLVPTAFVSKDRVRGLPALHEHAIVRAPMGTVFRVRTEEWEGLRPLLAEPPAVAAPASEELPAVFAWEQRAKSVQPMPGGYDGYLTALRRLCDVVEEERPTSTELAQVIRRTFGVASNPAQALSAFVRRMGWLEERAGSVTVGEPAQRWRSGDDPAVVIALLHARAQFVGELLAEARSPRSTEELLDLANRRYGMGWTTNAQIDRRRGWLQSAGMLSVTPEKALVITEAGSALLARLDVQAPIVPPSTAPGPTVAPPVAAVEISDPPPSPEEVVVLVDREGDATEALIEELVVSSTASTDPDRFERAVREGFASLGFEAEWLGGAGKTDVLLDAPLGRDDTYRVIIDAKTSASGSVSDQQIDWVTLDEHRVRHDADHVAVVAPSPHGSRLFDRAAERKVTVFSVQALGGLLRQHARAPLGLDAYRRLFAAGGAVDTGSVAEAAEGWLGVVGLARAVIDAVASRSKRLGPLTARDLFLVLSEQPVTDAVEEVEIQAILDTLSSPLFAVLAGEADRGYLLTTPVQVAARRLHVIAVALRR